MFGGFFLKKGVSRKKISSVQLDIFIFPVWEEFKKKLKGVFMNTFS